MLLPAILLSWHIAAHLAEQTPPAHPSNASHSARQSSALHTLLTSQGYVPVPLVTAVYGGVYLVAVKVDGQQFTLLLDTGANLEVGLSVPASKKLGDFPLNQTLPDTFASPSLTSRKTGFGSYSEIAFPTAGYRVRHQGATLTIIDGLQYEVDTLNIKSGNMDKIMIDGLLGQRFLESHSAVIDSETDTMYLLRPQLKDGRKLTGRWECVGGERDGKPLDNPQTVWLQFWDDTSVELHLGKKTLAGDYALARAGAHRYFYMWTQAKDGSTQYLCQSMYSVSGDRLRLCLSDDGSNKLVTEGGPGKPPTKFEAKAGSGLTVYEFRRDTTPRLK